MSAAVLEEAMASGASLDDVQFPQSVRDLCAGRLGFPHHGIPKALQRLVLKEKADTDVLTTRPGASLPPADVDAELAMLAERLLLFQISEHADDLFSKSRSMPTANC